MQSQFEKFQKILQESSLDAIMLSHVSNIFYATGFAGFSKDEREGYALITKKEIYVFTDPRLSGAIKVLPHLKLIEISATTPLSKAFKDLVEKEKLLKIGFEPRSLTVAEYTFFKKLARFTPLSLDTLRELKDKQEINAIYEACRLGDQAFEYICGFIKPGMSEKEIALEIEIFFKRHVADISFPAIVAFGSNSAIPHHSPTDKRLNPREIIKLDFGCRLNNYCSDMTRTIFIGQPTSGQRKVYEIVKKAQEESLHLLSKTKQPLAHDIDQAARDYIIKQGYPTIPHSLGHGIGIEVHEKPSLSPNVSEKLQSGMVFSIEPGIYLSGKFGVRIEDIVTNEDNKPRLLTHASRELIVL